MADLNAGNLNFGTDWFKDMLKFLENEYGISLGENSKAGIKKLAGILPAVLAQGFNLTQDVSPEIPSFDASPYDIGKSVALGEQDRITGTQLGTAAAELGASGLGPVSVMENLDKIRRRGAATRGNIGAQYNTAKANAKQQYDNMVAQIMNKYNLYNQQSKTQGISDIGSLLTLALGLL